MKNWFRLLFDIILPPRCLCCGKVVSADDCLCADCFKKITFIGRPYCERCGHSLNAEEIYIESKFCATCLHKKDNLRMSRAAVEYDDYSKKLILDFKFNDHIENKKLLARWLFMAGKDIFTSGVDIIIPVPLHYTRLFKRKYNQSAILAAQLSKLCNIPVEYKVLRKIKHTRPQVLCDEKQRAYNVKNAFNVVRSDKIKGKRVLLIDDVFTTGATLRECAKVLKKAGAKSVDTLTVAKVCKH